MFFTLHLRPLLRVPPLHTLSGRAFSTTPQLALARLSVLGRLAAPAEVITTGQGREVVRYTLATTHGAKHKQIDWWRVSFFTEGHNTALKERLLGLPQGSQVFMEGDASTRKFQDSQGSTQTTLNIIQRHLTILYVRQAPGSEAKSEGQSEGESEVESEVESEGQSEGQSEGESKGQAEGS